VNDAELTQQAAVVLRASIRESGQTKLDRLNQDESQAYNACSNMPRFGHSGILTEQQVQDVTALLLDPASPVNK
jgi:hypothetical protein